MLFAFLSGFKFLTTQVEGDLTDRLHYFMTSNLLIALAILVSWKQFGGKPVECMIPETFHSPWEQYAENYCWAEATYYVSFETGLPSDEERDKRISYYQWVPFYLLLAAVSFQIPCFFWKLMAGHSGIKIHDVVQEAGDRKNLAPLVRQETIRMLTVHIENALRFHRRSDRRKLTPHNFLRLLNLPYTASYVTICYLITKILYLTNVVAQFYMMNLFLETKEYDFFGFGAVKAIINGTRWEHTGIFPRVTLCDMKARVMGNIQRHTFQCVLTINLFNEKIFIFLWFWYWVLFILSSISLFYWVMVTLTPCFVRNFISRHLALSELVIDIKACQLDIRRFIAKYLKIDGIFILRMITMHAGVIFGTDLIANLYRSFYGIEETKIKKKIKKIEKKMKNAQENHNDDNCVDKQDKKKQLDPGSSDESEQAEQEQMTEYEHSPEQQAVNRFMMQLSNIRHRRNSSVNTLGLMPGAGFGNSSDHFKATMGEALTVPGRLRMLGNDVDPTVPRPLMMSRNQIAHPLFEPKFSASKKSKERISNAMRAKERELREKQEMVDNLTAAAGMLEAEEEHNNAEQGTTSDRESSDNETHQGTA